MRLLVATAVRAAVPWRIAALVFVGGICLGVWPAGCIPDAARRAASSDIAVTPGVTFRRDARAGVQILDVDLARAPVRPMVVASNVRRRRNNFVGDCRTVREWAERTGAVGGMNAGFFGDTYDDRGRRKQIVGLAVVENNVVAPGGSVVSTQRAGERFLRAAVGFRPSGTPDIAWASATLAGDVRRYANVLNPGAGQAWPVRSAVACGPRLFVRGARRITDREERLISPGRVPRAFVAYDLGTDKRPRHLILGRADAMDFAQVADWLESYFARTHNTRPHDALCMDGGASAQLVYRHEGRLHDAEPTGVLVPTAILLVPK
jgi:hypothetical protein